MRRRRCSRARVCIMVLVLGAIVQPAWGQTPHELAYPYKNPYTGNYFNKPALYKNPYTGNSFNNPTSSYIDTVIQGNMRQKELLESLGKTAKSGAAPSTEPRAAPKVPISATDFKRRPGAWIMPRQLADGQRDASAADKKEIEGEFTQVLDYFASATRKNNMSSALAYLFGTAIEVGEGRKLPDDIFERFVVTINEHLAATPVVKTMPDQKKQQLYEYAILKAAVMESLNESGDAAKMQKAKQMAHTELKAAHSLTGK